jgi:NTE family protein
MHSKFLGSLFFLIVLIWPVAGYSVFQDGNKSMPPKIGLTLSGGGAKGLAHVGVLHIIDSLGIKIDYVTGTSMGSIVGGMYAAGYTASELEEIALTLDWPSLFSSRASLRYTHPGKREEFGRYIAELPIENGSIKLPSGAIEGQQMWNVLSDFFFNVRNISDFNDFPIPFACVATDVLTGDTVVLNSGDIVAAIRASISIPSVFTTIEIDNRQLVDGGVVMNFPVVVAKDMGADFIIGVNVSRGPIENRKLETPLDIIYQMGTYLDARNFQKNKELTDIYLEPDLEEYTAASFNNPREIIERGKQIARKNIDKFLELKDVSTDKRPAAKFAGRQDDQKIIIDSIRFN